ncbi:MAG: response regulator [Candidatus Eremiobacteraeota bacterium]|nr:response regulator [Candidatus Eremiobacteraeota bacterium]
MSEKDPFSPSIFIVDDDDSVRRSLSRLIRSEGLTPRVFPSAEAFLEIVPLESKGCLILDVRMPGMNGFELQEKLCSAGSPLQIIFISALQKPGEREHVLKCGALGLLDKPFSEEELMSLVKAAIAARQS